MESLSSVTEGRRNQPKGSRARRTPRSLRLRPAVAVPSVTAKTVPLTMRFCFSNGSTSSPCLHTTHGHLRKPRGPLRVAADLQTQREIEQLGSRQRDESGCVGDQVRLAYHLEGRRIVFCQTFFRCLRYCFGVVALPHFPSSVSLPVSMLIVILRVDLGFFSGRNLANIA